MKASATDQMSKVISSDIIVPPFLQLHIAIRFHHHVGAGHSPQPQYWAAGIYKALESLRVATALFVPYVPSMASGSVAAG
jgi:hypothetical protein